VLVKQSLVKIFLSLIRWLWFLNPYLLYLFPVVLFIIVGKRIRIMTLLYCTMSTYDIITSMCMKSGLYLHAALRSFPYLRSYVLEFVNNQTQSVGKTKGDTFLHSFAPPLSFRLVLTAFENFEYPWEAQASSLLLSCLLNRFWVLLRVKQVVKNIMQRPAPGLDSCEWLGVWDSMGKYLGQWAPPVCFKLTPEQVQDPNKLVKYLQKMCCHPGNSRETQIPATCWGLAHAYRALFNTVQCLKGERGGNEAAGTAAGTASPAGPAAPPAQQAVTAPPTGTTAAAATGVVPASPAGTAAAAAPAPAPAPAPAAGSVAEPNDQPVPVAVAPVKLKKDAKRADCSGRDDNEPGSSREIETEIITRSLSLGELRDMRKDFRRHPGEHIATWLLRCWDNGASSLELEGKEAKQLGSLARDGGIDKAIGKKEQVLSLWRRLLSGLRERYPFSDDFVCYPGKWTNMERGIQYLRELAVRELVYCDTDNEQVPTDPDEVQCTASMWRKFVRSATSSYANSVVAVNWKGKDAPTVDEVAVRLRQYEESLSSSIVSAVEKLARGVRQIKENMSYSPPVRASVSAISSKRFSAQERENRGYTPRGTLWFYLRDHGEDMRKWDAKPTSSLEARVSELRGKTITKGDSVRKNAPPVSSSQLSRPGRQFDLDSDPLEGTS